LLTQTIGDTAFIFDKLVRLSTTAAMKYYLLLFALLGYYHLAEAQDITVRRLPNEVFRNVKKDNNDTAQWLWKRGGLFNLNVSQGSLVNWAAGGDNFTLAINSYFNYYILHKKGRYTWDNSLDVNFGFIQTTSLGSRKNDDRFDLLSKVGYKMDTANKWYLSGLFNFRSQFFDGLTYSGNNGTLSSTFLSPAYVVLSIGFDYKPKPNFSLFMSPLTSRWVVVASNRLASKGLYGVPAGRNSIGEIGAFASVNYQTEIMKNVHYRGKLDLFSNYNNNPENIDIFLTNLVSFKINKYLSATYNLDLIYDDDVKLFGDNKTSPALQLKSVIGIGFLMKLTPILKTPPPPITLPQAEPTPLPLPQQNI